MNSPLDETYHAETAPPIGAHLSPSNSILSRIYTVTELTGEIRRHLEEGFPAVWVTGEISNVRQPSSGHVYLTLKDSNAQLAAVIWRSLATQLIYQIRDGLQVVAFGEITVYEPRGQYQLIIRRIEPKGIGALQIAFQQLKEKLQREGLFDPAHKRPLPFLPRCIGVVTSPTGAAIRDIITTITRRCPKVRILLCPVRVQGEGAAQEIAEGIALLNRLPEVEVMIVGRGGGSLEDLWPFNEEVVARAIYGSRVPVISAVGHEIDFTIADFVADVRAPTPTAAGELVVPDATKLMEELSNLRHRLAQRLLSRVTHAKERLDALSRSYAFRQPFDRIRRHEQRLDDLIQRMARAIVAIFRHQRQRLEIAQGKLHGLSPLNVLSRGYSITMTADNRHILRDASEVIPGTNILTRLAKGEFRSIAQ